MSFSGYSMSAKFKQNGLMENADRHEISAFVDRIRVLFLMKIKYLQSNVCIDILSTTN